VIAHFQAIVMGLVQGVTELFPISSLAQAVILPTILGWDNLARAQSQPESFFLAFLVGLHVATAHSAAHLLLERLARHHRRLLPDPR